MRLRALTATAALALGTVVALPHTADAAASSSASCDPIDPTACLLPFPDNWFTTKDNSTATGLRVNFTTAELPRNILGQGIDPAEWNLNDGFSPGSNLLVHVPGIDLAKTGAAPVTNIGASLGANAPIVILDTNTGKRWPYFAELDANAASKPGEQALIVRPAVNLTEGHHYVVALRNLKTASGATIRPNSAFKKIEGPTLPRRDKLAARQRAERPVLKTLKAHGVGTGGLYLAWDFTVASARNLTERMVYMRDDAFGRLGSGAPTYTIKQVTDNAADDPIARVVTGTVWVPSYLNVPTGPPGSRFTYNAKGLPVRLPGNFQPATFQCEIPRSAYTTPATPGLYGHGLLGDESEVGSGAVRQLGGNNNLLFCATKWAGMSSDDLVNVAATLMDVSNFPSMADRMQQGILNMMWLGRALDSPKGFATNKAFQNPAGTPVIDTAKNLVYDGNSQGGIMGGALTAVSTDIHRAALGVTGMNYSTLLNRSTDFSKYATVLNTFYPNKLDEQLDLGLMQMLWDRGETNGYAEQLTDHPLPGTPKHQVIMDVAVGDHQVSELTAEIEARTIGAAIHTPAVAAGRDPDVVPFWGIPAITSYPYTGSAMVIWDSGVPWQPLTDTPPSADQHDPHSDPRWTPAEQQQQAIFLTTGQIVDTCGGAPCTAPQH